MTDDSKKISVSYNVDNNGEYTVDIDILDYSTETIDQLATLLASIPSVQFQVQTMNIVKQAFITEERTKELESLIASVLLKSENILESLKKESRKEDKEPDEPCIKPSDIL
tara:strand:- start:976 stop:1308 length:333 start_codon:yes stop_codon:yes gene_type:complete